MKLIEVNIRVKVKLIFKTFLSSFLVFILFSYSEVNANIICNDGTVSASCVDCHQGCCSRHGGCTPGASSSSNTNKKSNSKNRTSKSSSVTRSVNKTVPVVIKKSNNSKLKKVTIDSNDVFISDDMEYKTTNEKVVVRVETESNKATAKYNSLVRLDHGNNRESIEVTAEDGSKKKYNLTIKMINNNNNIKKVMVDDKNVSLRDMKYQTFNNTANIEVVLEDQYAKAEYEKQVNLKIGDNEFKITVIAENGDKKEYKLIINYDDSLDGSAGYIAGGLVAAGAGTAAVTGIYYSRKKKHGELGKINKCSNCNKNNSPKSIFCTNCGSKLN